MMTFANKVTLFRIVSIPFFIGTLIFYSPERPGLKWAALGLFLLAIVSDVIDGYIARTRRQKTKAGAILDPLADKALLLTAFIFLYRMSHAYLLIPLPLWVMLVVVSRDTIIIIGSAIILMANKNIQIEPTRWGKLTTFFQMLTVIALILEWRAAPLAWWVAVFFTVISGIDYIRKGINALNFDQGQNHDKNDRGPHL